MHLLKISRGCFYIVNITKTILATIIDNQYQINKLKSIHKTKKDNVFLVSVVTPKS